MTPSVFSGTERSGLHLVVFGGGAPGIRRAARRLGREAVATGWFSNVVVIHEEHVEMLDPSFFTSRKELFRSDSPGFGYWSWKPFILERYLSHPSLAADAIIYLDAGCHLNVTPQSTRRFKENVHHALENGGTFFSMVQHSQGDWISDEAATYLALTAEESLLPQVVSGTFILRNDDENRELTSRWLHLSQIKDGRLLASKSPNHRHDQSLLSYLVYNSGIAPLPDETWNEDWNIMIDFPFWTVRNRTGFRYRPSPTWNRVNRVIERTRGRLVFSSAPKF